MEWHCALEFTEKNNTAIKLQSKAAAEVISVMEDHQRDCAMALLILTEQWKNRGRRYDLSEHGKTTYDQFKILQDVEDLFAMTHDCIEQADIIGTKYDLLAERIERAEELMLLTPRSKKAAIISAADRLDRQTERMKRLKRQEITASFGIQDTDSDGSDSDEEESNDEEVNCRRRMKKRAFELGEDEEAEIVASTSMGDSDLEFSRETPRASVTMGASATASVVISQSASGTPRAGGDTASTSRVGTPTPTAASFRDKRLAISRRKRSEVALAASSSATSLNNSISQSPSSPSGGYQRSSTTFLTSQQKRQTMPWMTTTQLQRAKEDLISLECQIEVQYNRCRVRCEAVTAFIKSKTPRRRGDTEIAHEAELEDYREKITEAKHDGAQTLYKMMQEYAASSFETGWGQELADYHLLF